MPRLPPLSKFTDPSRGVRDCSIRVRITADEKIMFDDLAEHHEINCSELIRALIRREAAQVAKEKGYD